MLRRVGAILLCAAALRPAAAAAQPAGGYARLSLSMSGDYEGNLFATPTAPISDYMTRFGPLFEAGYDSEPLNVLLRAEVGAERYANHPELDQNIAYKGGEFSLVANPTERFGYSASAQYVDTQNPAEFAVENVQLVGRAQAKRRMAATGLNYSITQRTRFLTGYDFTRELLDLGYGSWLHTARIGFDHRTGSRDRVRFMASGRLFSFDAPALTGSSILIPVVALPGEIPGLPADADVARVPIDTRPARRSYTATIGWVHESSPRASLEVDAGPRVTSRTWLPEISAGVRREFQRGDVQLRYLRTEQTAIGEPWPLDMQRVFLIANYRPSERFWLSAAPSYSRDVRKRDQVDIEELTANVPPGTSAAALNVFNQVLLLARNHVEVYSVELSASFQARRVTFVAGTRIAQQMGRFGGTGEIIPMRNVTLKLVLTPPPSRPNMRRRPESLEGPWADTKDKDKDKEKDKDKTNPPTQKKNAPAGKKPATTGDQQPSREGSPN
jgi:hypothetical protein